MSIEEAERYKVKANEYLKEGKYEDAVKEYNKAITLVADNPIYLSNRSAAWAAWGKFDNALNDANKCIECDKKFIKGYSRKGLALYKLGRVKEAQAAYQAGLLVDPTNASLKQAIASIRADEAKKQISRFPNPFKGTKVGDWVDKIYQNSILSKLFFYLLIFGVYYFWTQSGSKKDDSAVGDQKPDPHRLQHRGISLATGKSLHIVKRPKIPDLATYSSPTLLGSSMIFFHAHGFSIEEYTSIYKYFPNINILGMDLPCHGRSSCWAPVTPTEWEELGKKLLSSEGDFLGKNRILVLSGFSPFMTRQLYDHLSPIQVVWSEPNKLGIDSKKYLSPSPSSNNTFDNTSETQKKAEKSDNNKPAAKEKWSTRKLISYLSENYDENEVDDMSMGLTRDILNFLMLDKKDTYIPKKNVTELILDEVITAPHLILNPSTTTYSDKKIRTVKKGKLSLTKGKKWSDTVMEWLEESTLGEDPLPDPVDHDLPPAGNNGEQDDDF